VWTTLARSGLHEGNMKFKTQNIQLVSISIISPVCTSIISSVMHVSINSSKVFKTASAFYLGFAREELKTFSHFKCLHGQHTYRFSRPALRSLHMIIYLLCPKISQVTTGCTVSILNIQFSHEVFKMLHTTESFLNNIYSPTE
jgi:hypothetical protein